MKMWLEQRRPAMLQLHLSDRQFNCLLKYVLYFRDLTVIQKNNGKCWVVSLNDKHHWWQKTCFFNHFMNLSNPNDPFYSHEQEILHEYETMIENDIQCTFEELNDIIGETEVINAIKLLKRGKSSGEDFLINYFFFYGKDHLSYYLTVLFKYVFQSDFFPRGWSDGLLVPLHKKGSFSDPQNFRGITLLSVLQKHFIRVILVS